MHPIKRCRKACDSGIDSSTSRGMIQRQSLAPSRADSICLQVKWRRHGRVRRAPQTQSLIHKCRFVTHSLTAPKRKATKHRCCLLPWSSGSVRSVPQSWSVSRTHRELTEPQGRELGSLILVRVAPPETGPLSQSTVSSRHREVFLMPQRRPSM